jgi:glycosyltransferase involved in cell wall biosynthesis
MTDTTTLDVIMCTSGDWLGWQTSGYVRRNSQMFRGFERDPRVRRLLLVDNPRSSFHLARRLLDRRREPRAPRLERSARHELHQIGPKTALLSLYVPLPREYGHRWIYDVNRRALRPQWLRATIRRAARATGITNPVLWVDNPFQTDLFGTLEEALAVFDCIDDWRLNPRLAGFADLLERGYERALGKSDLFVTVSRALREQFQGCASTVTWIPNGVEAAAFGAAWDVPPELARIPRPWIGYLGAMADGRIDVPLLAAVARRLPRQSFVVIGHSPPPELASLPNCHLIGSFPYHRIPAFVAHFDVAVMPHKVDAYNRSANPLKLLQYLAAGKPIVSTAVPNTEDYPGLVRIAAGAEEFGAQVLAALDEPSESALCEQRREAARRASWEHRHADVMALLLEHMGRRTAPRADEGARRAQAT